MSDESTGRISTLGGVNKTAYMRAATKGGDCWEAAAQAVADEAIRRYHAALPPGNEGLLEAFRQSCGFTWQVSEYDQLRYDRGIAVMLDLLKHRGWLSPDEAEKLRESSAAKKALAERTAERDYAWKVVREVERATKTWDHYVASEIGEMLDCFACAEEFNEVTREDETNA